MSSSHPHREAPPLQAEGAERRPPPPPPAHSMDPAVELPRVLLALQAVYAPSSSSSSSGASTSTTTSRHPLDANDDRANDGNFDRRDVADRYLTSFQRAPVAWMVCDRLLSPSSSSSSSDDGVSEGDGADADATLRTQRSFFAAQTLHAKCLGDVHQLPRESLTSLRDSLLSHFVRHATDAARATIEYRPSNRPLVTRLSMAIAALAVQMGWNTALVDVSANVLVPYPQLGPAVLELFRSVPEEADSNRLMLASRDDDDGGGGGGRGDADDGGGDDGRGRGGRLRAYRDMLRESAHVVLGLCERAVASSASARGGGGGGGSDVATTEAVLGCLQSWIRIVDIDPTLLERTSLLPWVFDVLVDSTNGGFEMAVDVVVELLRTYPSDRRGVEGLVRAVIPRVMALGCDNDAGGIDHRGARRPSPFAKSISDEDEDGMRGYCRIFTEMSESYLSLILSHEEMNQSSLVDLVLRCSSIPDKEIAGITLHFWYRFVIGLEDLEPFEYRQIKIDSFAPQLHRLLDVCTTLLRYPVGVEDLSPDRLDDIEGIRMYFADTIEDCCRLLGGDAVLRATGDPLRMECGRVSLLPPDAQLVDWHGIEGYMYAIQAVSIYVPSDEARNIPFVMGLIPQLPGDAPLLRATACRTVGKYASWLGVHASYLGPLLPYLAQGLSMPKCASSAAVAIREICERCDTLGDSVLQLYDAIVAAREQHRRLSLTGGNVSGGEDFILDLKNEMEVLEGVCKAVSSKLTNDPSIIHHLAHPIIDNLRAMAAPEAYPSPKQISGEVCRMTTLVQHMRLPRPSTQQAAGTLNRSDFILGLMGETWPMLDAVSQKYPRDFNCGEKLCRLHKHALRECGAVYYAPLLKPLVEQTIKNFSMSLSSPYLYLASIIVSEYGGDVTQSNLLYNMMASLASTVFHALRSTDDFTAHPDVVEEFFFLAGRMISHCPSPLVQSSLFNSLLQCAGVGMKLYHKDANRGTLNFLENTVSYSLKLRSKSSLDATEQANIASLEQAIVAEGQPLVTNLALALLGDLPAYRLDSGSGSIAGVLFYLNQLCPELLMQWIQPPLTAAPEHAKSSFLVMLHNQVAREEFNSSVRRFTAVCERSRTIMV